MNSLILTSVYGASGTSPTPTVIKTNEAKPQVSSDNSVNSMVELEKILYIGGNFTNLSIDKKQATRKNLASFNQSTVEFTNWQPQPNGAVESISINYDTIYIAGGFTQVNGQKRQYLASFDRVTGELTPWSPQVNGEVYSVFVDGGNLYVGGSFTTINDQPRNNIASFDIVTGELTSWNPNANGSVYAISSDNITLYIGGEFTEIAGQPRRYIAAFDKAAGELTNWQPEVTEPIRDIYIYESNVYLSRSRNPTQNVNAVVASYNPEDNTVSYFNSPTPVSAQAETTPVLAPPDKEATVAGLMIDRGRLGFRIPTLTDVLTFVIRGFFVIAGLAALFYLLMGALAWVTS